MKALMSLLLLLPILSTCLSSKEYIFNINEKGTEYKNFVNINKIESGYYLKSTVNKEEEKDSVMEAKLNKDFETVEWKLKNPKKSIDVIAVREGNIIILTGTFSGKENNKKEIYIDNRPWHQIFQLGLMKFAISETKEKSIEFWGLRPDNPESSGVLAASKDKVETIEVNGKKIETAKLRIGLAGWLSIFWTGDYWFRLSDGLYIMAKPTGNVSAVLVEEKE
ncbi:MAG: hypothetical protein A2452_12135 [Candidatus Firestonebacteria bacterium RIFOXYC2_FULL_39_67]|nr:MAG: hypothetical protein A2536_00200 [Candidatus Firestonebacteria bacterium RIFOXYD2_FULL_39_29]OGF55716.1 MAG: hypothetical protein A2452_12135 [Candidatus Firestonebacteria bacterium RIFOXYC2_FULL_39_67]OGF57967.1 MAG: hypothetical protein A2497_02400 [Candidatus Firestonebacteria bacterium RifOxyC12_full_39_7]